MSPTFKTEQTAAVRKVKKMKRKVFDKDDDDQYLVVVNPYREGRSGRWELRDVGIIAEWLRRASGWRTQCVYAVYTVAKVISCIKLRRSLMLEFRGMT